MNIRKGSLEKKGTMMWSKKYVSFNATTLELVVADKETSSSPIFVATLKEVQVNPEDNAILNFVGDKGEQIALRGNSMSQAGNWYDYIYGGLEEAEVVKARHGFLPRKDPRFGVSFLRTLPEEYITRFTKLEHSVLYWFAEIKKLEKGGFGSSKKAILENRIAFLSDKCLYITHRDGTVTHCMKVADAEACFTNLTLIAKGTCTNPPFVVFKCKDVDIHLEAAHLKHLLQAVAAIYNHHHSYRTLEMKESDSPLDGSVRLNLNPDVKMAMVVPTSKCQLKKALDQFATKHGIEFEADTTGSSAAFTPDDSHEGRDFSGHIDADGRGIKSVKKVGDGPISLRTSAAAASKKKEEQLPMTDPLACFLANCDLSKLYFSFVDHSVDLDCLEVMDADDMANFGVKDPAVINLLKYKLSKEELLQEARDQAESVQRGSQWVKSTTVDANSPTLPNGGLQSPTLAPAPASNEGSRKPSILDESSDDDLDLAPAKKPTASNTQDTSAPQAKKAAIFSDSDSDDDFDLGSLMTSAKPPASRGGSAMKISLDSDSDEDVFLPAKKATTAAPKPVILDDDDI